MPSKCSFELRFCTLDEEEKDQVGGCVCEILPERGIEVVPQ